MGRITNRLIVIVQFVLLLLVIKYDKVNSQDACGAVGHSDQTEHTRLTDLRFYLNTQSFAPCSGNVTTWEYCYYQPNVTAVKYWASFGIYRLIGSDYRLVSDRFRIIIQDDDIGSNSLTCRTFTTPVTAIIEGDVVGACVHDVITGILGGSRAQINLAGDNAPGNSIQFADTSNGRCQTGVDVSVPNRVSEADLSSRSSTVLHLYTNIEPTTEATASIPTPIEDTNTPTVTTDNTMVPSVIGDTSDGNIALIVGSVVGALLLIVMISAIVCGSIVCLVWSKKRKFKTVYNIHRGSRASSPGFDNINYQPYETADPATEGQANMSHHQYEFLNADKDSFIYSGSYDEVMASSSEQYQNTSRSRRELSFSNRYAEVMVAQPDDPDDKTRTLSYLKPYDEVMRSTSSPLDDSVVSYAELLEKNEREDAYDDSNPYCVPPAQEEEIYGQIRTCGAANIPRSAVVTCTYLGSGQFGRVEQGSWLRPGNIQIPVAIKTLNQGSSKQDKVKFLQEAAIMAQFRHPNVITLHGVVSHGEPIMLIVELARKGDLRHYLNTIKPDPGLLPSSNLPLILLNISQQVALGMQYLASKGFVHRDLAARNILVSEKMICKIADFGLSRDLADEAYYIAHGGTIPVKWTAPEALNYKKYSTASDVWSYGCLLYEIWGLGQKPFNTLGNLQVLRLVDTGYRLPPPPGCPLRIYDHMIKCWHPVASSRPSFYDVCTVLAGNEKDILRIPQEALESNQLAGVLGSSLTASEHMYMDLQNVYCSEASGSYELIT